jgi:hypothetical protein
VPEESIRKGLAYLNNNRGGDGSYGYTSASGGKPTLTAIGSLCLSLAKERDSKGYKASLEYLKKNLDYRDRYYPYYYEYYMSQALFHADDGPGASGTRATSATSPPSRQADGSFPGNQGPSFNTAGACSHSPSTTASSRSTRNDPLRTDRHLDRRRHAAGLGC